MRAMRGVLFAMVVSLGCGGSTSSAVFDEEQDSSSTIEDTSTVDSIASETSEEVGEDATAETTVDATPETTVDAKPDAPLGCPKGSTTVPGDCPAACTGGCEGDVCKIACGLNACGNTKIQCPPSMRCRVECSGITSCGNSEVRCPENAPCEVVCSGTSACGGIKVTCPKTGGSCGLGCTGTSSCGMGEIDCGAGACLAQCSGLGATAKQSCNSACACKKEGC
jgi:hypothetical protein